MIYYRSYTIIHGNCKNTLHSNYLSLSRCHQTSILVFFQENYLEKTKAETKQKQKKDERCAYFQPTGAASFDLEDILVTSSQISRQSLLSLDKFCYLDVPKLDEIMIYDDFECTFKCSHHPLCVSVNLPAEGDLWCELPSSDKYSNPNGKEKKGSHHYFF